MPSRPKIRKYRSRPQSVEAVQWLGHLKPGQGSDPVTVQQLRQWGLEFHNGATHGESLFLVGGQEIKVFDWIIRERGEWRVVRPVNAAFTDFYTDMEDALVIELGEFGTGTAATLALVFSRICKSADLDPMHFLLFMACALQAGADPGKEIYIKDVRAEMEDLSKALNIDVETEMIITEGQPS